MPHELTHEQLDQKVYDSLEARRRRREAAAMGGQREMLTARLREAMARRRQARGGTPSGGNLKGGS